MTNTSRNATTLLATVLLVALAGCSRIPLPTPVSAPETIPASPVSTDAPAEPDSEPEPEPEPEPTVVVPVAIPPDQRIDVPCPDLLTDSQLNSMFGRNVVGLKYIEMEAAIAYPSIPETYAVRQLGGMACEWSNGVTSHETTGTSPNYQGIQITYLPDATKEWDYYAGLYGVSGTRDLHCFSYTTVNCSLNSLVGTGWLEVSAHGMLDSSTDAAVLARFSTPVETIEAALLAGTVSPDAWSPPPATLAMPGECPPLVSNAAVGAALGLGTGVASNGGPHGGWSIEAGAARMAGQTGCAWLFTGGDAGVGSIRWLPGGEWAWNELQNYVFDPAVGAFAELPVTGLAAGDSAWVRCSAGNAVCTADLVVGGNWINVYLWPDYTAPIDRRTAIATIATEIIDSLR